MQDRVGPNRVGPIGLLQPIADGLKFVFKEEVIPAGADKVFFVVAPTISVFTTLLAFSVVPFGPTPTNGNGGFPVWDRPVRGYRDHFRVCRHEPGRLRGHSRRLVVEQ